MLGIDSDPSRNSESLCNISVDYDRREEVLKNLLVKLLNQNFQRFYRTRGLFEMEDQQTKKVVHRLSLNELFVADQDVQ